MPPHRRKHTRTHGRRLTPYSRTRPFTTITTTTASTAPFRDESTVEGIEIMPAPTVVDEFQQTLEDIAQLEDYVSTAARHLFHTAINKCGTDSGKRQLFVQAVLTRMLNGTP